MPKVSLLLCCFASLFSCLLLSGAAQEKNQTLPSFKLSCAQGQTPQKCLNQAVTLEARIAGFDQESAREILQHPDMRPPIGEWEQYQTVISSNMGQVNILTETKITCPKVKLQGVLTEYTLNCGADQGGKCDYHSYVIQLKSFSCLK